MLSSAAIFENAVRLRGSGCLNESIEAFKKVLSFDPSFAEAHHQLGNVLKSLRRYPEAIASLCRASELAPKVAAVWLNLGVAYLEFSLLDKAIHCFTTALQLEPGRAEAHNVLGTALLSAGRSTDAQHHFETALNLKPMYPAAHDNLGRLLRAQGQADEAILHFRAALAQGPQSGTHSNLLYALNFSPSLTPETLFAEHRVWNSLYATPLRAEWAPHQNDLSSTRRIRVGYVSPDFVHHAVSYFIEPILAAHSRTRFDVYCYTNALVSDYVTERLRRTSDHWRDIAGLTDKQAALLIREDRIDLLVDLAGHTARHRLLVFALKPAPVQLTWIGYPNTTGLDAIDYRLTDAVCDPPGTTEAWHSEALLRLPETFSCYQPPAESPEVRALPAASAGCITFGCFNHLAKIGVRVIECWAALLVRIPTARLFLKARGLADERTASRLRERFRELGISPERLEFNHDELSVAQHLALYGRVDVALDPFPYTGTTTSCEALWMGVPVVTLAGRTHVTRVTASLLTHLGLAEWIANSEIEYEKIAISAADDLTGLARLRADLRKRMQVSPLCDASRFVNHLEKIYSDIWRAYVAEIQKNLQLGAYGIKPDRKNSP